ncbi:MAG: twin-arginine translocation signal domain-containing protein [Acidobacteria bacterium]|nr:twin-arginine translocation signal domain-containing protein [Acidobacteriota bacterium]
MARSKKHVVGRRGFLKGAAVSAAAGAATLVTELPGAQAQTVARPQAPVPSPAALAREAGPAPAVDARIIENPASDYMVDVLRALGIEYIASNPGSSFDGLQESVANYGKNTAPEWLTCLHEESSVAMAHGWAKIEGKPTLMPMLHGVTGLQHGSMAIYNAYVDRVPVFMVAGVQVEGGITAHSGTDIAGLVRGYVKWDQQPNRLEQFPTSMLRAYRLAMTPPMAPTMVVLENRIAKQPMGSNRPALPKLTLPEPPSADIGSIRETAKLLVAAENPRINAGRLARTERGVVLLVELAELLQAPVASVGTNNRVSFPSRHPLAGVGAEQPDLVLNLEVIGGGNAPGVKTIAITAAELLATSNLNVLPASPQADLLIEADGEASLPALIEEVKRLLTGDRKRVFLERGAKHAEANKRVREQAIASARLGWDASPISLARLAAELWPLIKNEDWSLVCPQDFIGNWPNRLWNMDKLYRHTGGRGGEGMGYGAPAAVGAALANKKYGRLSINIQQDGDLNYAPGVLWTAVHHKIPLLTIMHNNRGYHAEVMFMQREANTRNRGVDMAHIGTRLIEPNIDYAKMAQGYGMYGEGPIADPDQLVPALKRGIEHVKRGEPALIDVLTQPR